MLQTRLLVQLGAEKIELTDSEELQELVVQCLCNKTEPGDHYVQ